MILREKKMLNYRMRQIVDVLKTYKVIHHKLIQRMHCIRDITVKASGY